MSWLLIISLALSQAELDAPSPKKPEPNISAIQAIISKDHKFRDVPLCVVIDGSHLPDDASVRLTKAHGAPVVDGSLCEIDRYSAQYLSTYKGSKAHYLEFSSLTDKPGERVEAFIIRGGGEEYFTAHFYVLRKAPHGWIFEKDLPAITTQL